MQRPYFDLESYENGRSDAFHERAPMGTDLSHKDPSYIAGVLNGVRFANRVATDGLYWDPQSLGSHYADVAQDQGLSNPWLSISFAAQQVLDEGADEAVEIATEQLQDEDEDEDEET